MDSKSKFGKISKTRGLLSRVVPAVGNVVDGLKHSTEG